MNEPRRLLEEEGSELERALLRSAFDDAPSPDGRRRTLVALGLAGGIGTAVTTTATTGAASTLLKTGAAVVMIKWIGVGMLGGLVTVGALAAVDAARAPSDAPAMVASKGHAPLAEQRAGAVASAARGDDAPAVAPPAPIPSGEARVEPVRAAPRASASAAPDRTARGALSDEVASLDAAHRALDAGDTAGALRAIDAYDRRFPGGALATESMVLRIEVLARSGDRASAARLGEAYLAAHPRSPYAARIRSLLGQPPAPP
jgi:hypothetical protein